MTLIPFGPLCRSDEKVSFASLSKRAQKLGHVLVGYQHKDKPAMTSINPKDKDRRRSWGEANFVVIKVADAREREKRRRQSRETSRRSFRASEPLANSGATHSDENAFSIQRIVFNLDLTLGLKLAIKTGNKLTVTDVLPNTQAAAKGVQIGWRFLTVGVCEVTCQADLIKAIQAAKEESLGESSCTVSVKFEVPSHRHSELRSFNLPGGDGAEFGSLEKIPVGAKREAAMRQRLVLAEAALTATTDAFARSELAVEKTLEDLHKEIQALEDDLNDGGSQAPPKASLSRESNSVATTMLPKGKTSSSGAIENGARGRSSPEQKRSSSFFGSSRRTIPSSSSSSSSSKRSGEGETRRISGLLGSFSSPVNAVSKLFSAAAAGNAESECVSTLQLIYRGDFGSDCAAFLDCAMRTACLHVMVTFATPNFHICSCLGNS